MDPDMQHPKGNITILRRNSVTPLAKITQAKWPEDDVYSARLVIESCHQWFRVNRGDRKDMRSLWRMTSAYLGREHD